MGEAEAEYSSICLEGATRNGYAVSGMSLAPLSLNSI